MRMNSIFYSKQQRRMVISVHARRRMSASYLCICVLRNIPDHDGQGQVRGQRVESLACGDRRLCKMDLVVLRIRGKAAV